MAGHVRHMNPPYTFQSCAKALEKTWTMKLAALQDKLRMTRRTAVQAQKVAGCLLESGRPVVTLDIKEVVFPDVVNFPPNSIVTISSTLCGLRPERKTGVLICQNR